MPTFNTQDPEDAERLRRWYEAATGRSTPATQDVPLVRLTGGQDTQPRTPTRSTRNQRVINDNVVQPQPQAQTPAQSWYTPNWSTPARAQTVPTRQQVQQEQQSRYRVDPLSAAVNQWRTSNRPQPEPVRYETPTPTFDYGLERPDTGPASFTAQNTRIHTRTINQPLNDVQTVEEQPRGLNAWTNTNWTQPAAGSMATAWLPTLVNTAYRLAGQTPAQREPRERPEGTTYNPFLNTYDNTFNDFYDSAAYEQMQFQQQQRTQNRENGILGTSTWQDVVEAGRGAGEAIGDFLFSTTFPDNRDAVYSEQERQQIEEAPGEFAVEQFGRVWNPLTSLVNMNYWTARAGQLAQAAGEYVGTPTTYAATGIDITDMPAAPYIASALDTMGQNLQDAWQDPGEFFSRGGGFMEQMTTPQTVRFWTSWMDRADQYRQAVEPSAEQRANNTPGMLEANRERSWLNTLGGLRATEATNDALNNRAATIDELNQQADQAWLMAMQITDPEERSALAAQAAAAGYEAERLRRQHPQEIVNENTNILRQLATEVFLPDLTDLAGGVFSVMGLTPAARRLQRVADEVMTPQSRALQALENFVVTGENAAEVAAQRSNYNKALNLWSTGTARANMATDKMVRYAVNLLADVETPGDAVILLRQLATDPRRLITGMDANLFQSPGLLARADNGVVRFGTMGVDRIAEPLRIYQQAAENVLNSPALKEGPFLNKADLIPDFIEQMNNAGYRYFNVATPAVDVPATAKSGRVKSVGPSQYVVEFLDNKKKVIGTSEAMTVSEARKLKGSIGSGQAAQKSLLGQIGQVQRSIVSPFYILTSPGTWLTNILGGVATAAGDGMMSTRSLRYIDDWTSRMFGIDPTVRGLESVTSAASSASQIGGRGVFKWLKNAYGTIDEKVGKRVFYSGASRALRQLGGNVLRDTLTPILTGVGVSPTGARRIVSHLHEVGMQGGDLAGEFNKLLNGQTRIFSLGEVNPTWVEAIPPDSLNGLYQIIREGGAADEVLGAVYTWADDAASYWDDFIASAPPPPQRYSWQKLEVAQDTADIQKDAALAVKSGGLPPEEVQAAAKAISDGMAATQQRLQTLTQMVTDAADPKNRYILYNAWGQMTDYTASVRARLAELAEEANTATGPAKQTAWQGYWAEAQRLWTERNAKVNQLLEDSSQAMASGADFTPRLDAWQMLERAAQRDADELMGAMRLEPQSGRYDARLAQVVEAGRIIGDQAKARTFAAARRFLNVDAFDAIVSAEHSVQIAGAQVAKLLERAREAAAKSGKWEDFFGIRNQAWREYRLFERDVWENATRNIVREGIGQETTTGLRFDAGPDGVVEIVAPRTDQIQKTDRLSGSGVQRTQVGRTVWDVRREDGTVTQVPDNMVPAELKAQFNGQTIDEAVEEAVDLEVANIQSTHPYAEDAQRTLEARVRAETLAERTRNPVTPPSRDVLPNAQQPVQLLPALQTNLDRVAQRVGATIEDLTAAGNDAISELTQSAPVAVQVSTGAVDDILDAGELRNSFQVGRTSPGKALDSDYRKTAELRGLGIPENAPPEQRPIYGYLLVNEYARETAATPNLNLGYGDITFVLKDDVRPRTTFVVGDSNNTFYNQRGVGTALDDVSPNAWAGEATATWEYANSGNLNQYLDDVGYLETQTTGGVRLGDIDSVLDPRNTLSPQQIQRLEQQGITVIQGETPASPPAASFKQMDAATFEAAVQDAANRVTADLGDKVFINRVYNQLVADNPGLDLSLDEFKTRLAQNHRNLLSRADMGYAMNRADVEASTTRYMNSEYQYIRQSERTYDLGVNLDDLQAFAQRYGINLFGLDGKKVAEVADDVTRRTTAAGGMQPGELGHGAAFAKQQLENIVQYIEQNIDDILTPKGRLIGQGSNLQALQEFRTRVLPAWDNVKYAASEYGNRMRGFAMVDFSNQTRLDELLSLYMPYGFWMTRTVKNSLERAIFEPQIWRRVMQSEQAMRQQQEQEGAPQRYEGATPVGNLGGQYQKWARLLPSKYWPLAGMFTQNDYADPESANSALGFALESMRAANLSSYPWWDIGGRVTENLSTGAPWDRDIYWPSYIPQGRIAADLALKFGGWDNATKLTIPGYFENATARTLDNMKVKGFKIDGQKVTGVEAKAAHDYLWQLKNGVEDPLPEIVNGTIDEDRVIAVLDAAVRETAGMDLYSALSSYLTGVSVRPYDPAEGQWTGAAENYRNYKYGPSNPYGSKMAADTQKEDASLAWSKAGVWREEEGRPGIALATEMKDAEKERLNAELMTATDEFITNYEDPEGKRPRPSNYEINQFKNQWMQEATGGDAEFFVDNMNAYLDATYPSATTFDGEGFDYEGYAPEEVKAKAYEQAYYQAKEDLAAEKEKVDALAPDKLPDNPTSAQWSKYWAQREKFDPAQEAYDQKLEARVQELMDDPQALRGLVNQYQLNPSNPGLVNDFARSLPRTMDDAFGYPVRPTGDGFNAGLVPMAGEPENAAELIYREQTKYMSDLEKETRKANEADGDSSGGGSGRSYRRSSYRPYRRSYSSGRRYYSGGGGGAAGGNYYVPQVDPRDFNMWVNFNPQAQAYEAPRFYQETPYLGPRTIERWQPLRWKS